MFVCFAYFFKMCTLVQYSFLGWDLGSDLQRFFWLIFFLYSWWLQSFVFGLYYLFHLLWGVFYFVCGSWGWKASFSEAEPLRGCLSLAYCLLPWSLQKRCFWDCHLSVNCLWSWSRSSKVVGEVKVIHMWLHLHICFLRRVGKDHDVHSF